MEPTIQARVDEWQKAPYDQATQDEIKTLVQKKDEKELIDRFYRELEFGTGGLRGTLGAGTNRMNTYVVQKVTQGLANYILQTGQSSKGIVIGRDSRIMSDRFAETVASVMIANGIPVYYFEDIHPTPTVSYAIRHYHALTGVMVTASHNPQEYNGYKVFWEDGAQVTPPHDKLIIKEVQKVTNLDQVKNLPFTDVKKSPLFKVIDQEHDPVYLSAIRTLSIHPEVIKNSGLKICYSPLYGTGYRLVPSALRDWGFTDIVLVEEQSQPDGRFPTAPFPNPEIEEAMRLGIQTARDTKSDILIATDPDADRIGAALRTSEGNYQLLNGNQIASLLVYYILTEKKNTGTMPADPRLVTTIVTTGLILDICRGLQVKAEEVLTGFKWIGLKAREYEESGRGSYIFGCEESHGYNAADFVRDKDAVSSACLFSEMAAWYKSTGSSVIEVLDRIYRDFGYYQESQIALTFKGKEGGEKIENIMATLRKSPPSSIAGFNTLRVKDIQNDSILDVKSGKFTGKVGLPSSNVISLELDRGAKVIARPSGTEPKIKFYFTTRGQGQDLAQVKKQVAQDHEALRMDLIKVLGLD